MGTITKRISSKGKLRYRAQVQIKGYPAQSKTFGHMKIAEKWIRDTEDAIRSGTHSAHRQKALHSLLPSVSLRPWPIDERFVLDTKIQSWLR